jgi:hypothetical protein
MVMKSAPPSAFIGWLDFGEDDQRRAKAYLAQFNSDNTLDELGFGILRDAFADVFFPATNTIMTRTRYLIFIARLCYAGEQEQLSGEAAKRRLKSLEDKLRESLLQEESIGVIGAESKETLHRYPSSIYWSALRRLGVFTRPWGQSYYQLHLADFHAAMKVEKDDDGLSHLNNAERRNWDKALCDIFADGHSIGVTEKEFPETLNFALTKHEARYLRMKYKELAAEDCRPSIISHLLEQLHPESFDYPWNVPYPPELELYVTHARYFSMFTRGATLQYFHLLQRECTKRGIGTPACDLSEVFSQWWEATRADLALWNLDEFFLVVAELNAIRRPNDRTFVREWLRLSSGASTADDMFEKAAAHDLIRERERITRPSKSRLHHSDYLQRWNPPKASGIAAMQKTLDTLRYGLDYRTWIGSTFVCDIVDGLAGTS